MKRVHEMLFGACVLSAGKVRFRLWAPAVKQVELILENNTDKEIPRTHNWSYDGALLFASYSSYGTTDDLKVLVVQAAHACGLMVLLDVVYKHFGPYGNYLHAYAPQFFSERHHTPWGASWFIKEAQL